MLEIEQSYDIQAEHIIFYKNCPFFKIIPSIVRKSFAARVFLNDC